MSALAEAIGEASMATDVNAMMLRTSETITALVRILASQPALVPDRSPTALRRRVQQIAKDLRRQASKLAADPTSTRSTPGPSITAMSEAAHDPARPTRSRPTTAPLRVAATARRRAGQSLLPCRQVRR